MTPAEYAQLMRRNSAKTEDRVQDALCRVADRGAVMAKARTREMGLVDTGGFAASWRGEDRGDNAAAVVNTKPYAPYVDDGQPLGNPPPLVVLVRWVERRLGLGGHQAWAAARTIQQHIDERGTAAAEITKWLGEKLKPLAEKEVAEELEREFRK